MISLPVVPGVMISRPVRIPVLVVVVVVAVEGLMILTEDSVAGR